MKKIIFFIFLFYFLILLQESFLIHFFSYLPNIVLMTVCFVNFFEDREEDFGIFISLIAGVLLDISSESFFGFYILTSLLISFFIKIVLGKYVQFNLRW